VITIKKEKVAIKNIMRILEAVFALSREKGFHSMTLRDLSRKSGLSMGALYSYFSGKEELRSMIRLEGVFYAKKVIAEQIAQYSDPSDRLNAAIETHLYLSEMLKPWFYFNYMEAANLPKAEKIEATENELATEKIFIDILADGVKIGAFGRRDVELSAAVIKAMLQDWYLKPWKYKRKSISVEGYADFVKSFVSNALSS
jgi:AcrR family transcriptional regulator